MTMLIILLIVIYIYYDTFFSKKASKTYKYSTSYDSAIKGLIVTIVIAITFGILFPFAAYFFIGNENISNAITQYIGTIIGAIISVFGALLTVIITLKKQKQKEVEESRVHKKLRMKKLYTKIKVYILNNSFLGMGVDRLTDDTLVYKYSRSFLELHGEIYNELANTSERLFDIFDKEFEGIFETCVWVLQHEKNNSKVFMAQLLDYDIFIDENGRKRLYELGYKDDSPENAYEYTDYQVFGVLESQIQKKLYSLLKEISDYSLNHQKQ